MREIKFRVWNKEHSYMESFNSHKVGMEFYCGVFQVSSGYDSCDNPTYEEDTKDKWEIMQFTGLQDKNGYGLQEVYEGDIIGASSIIGNIYETNPRETDLVIPSIGTKDWHDAYKKAVVRGFDYPK